MTNEMVDEFNLDELEGVEGTTVGLQQKPWDYPGSGYNIREGNLFLDSKEVDELEVTIFAIANWKNVTVGKRKDKKVLGSYHIKTAKNKMVEGDNVESRAQIIMKVGNELYKFGTGSAINTYGCWLKEGSGDAQYYAPGLDVGIWNQLQKHIIDVKRAYIAKFGKEKDFPQYAWTFTIAPAKNKIGPYGDYETVVRPLVRTSPFRFVGEDEFKANKQLYLSENLDEWVKKLTYPNGVITTSDEGTVINEVEVEETFEPEYEETEIPF